MDEFKKTLVFAGHEEILPSQLPAVQDRLDGLLASMTLEASVKFNDETNAFSIECQPGMAGAISGRFLANLNLLEVQEGDENSNENKEVLVQITTRVKSPVIMSPNLPNSYGDLEGLIFQSEQSLPDLVIRPLAKVSWLYPGPDTVQGFLPLPALEHLKRLTGCEIFRDFSTREIHISGPSGEVCYQVLQKFEIDCITYDNLKSSINHVIECEERSRFHVVAKRLWTVKNLLKTTLIDGINFPIKPWHLPKTSVLRCWEVEDKSAKNIIQKQSPAIEENDKGNLLKIWKSYEYKARGDGSNYPRGQDTKSESNVEQRQIQEAMDRQLSIQSWAENIPPGEQPPGDSATDSPQQETLMDTLQEDDEVQSREYHETMRQKSGRRGNAMQGFSSRSQHPANSATASSNSAVSSAQAKPSFVKEPLKAEIDDHLISILNSMRSWDGHLRLEVELGRILIRDTQQRRFANGDMTKSQIWKIAQLYLSELTQRGPYIYMTRLLTTLEADAQFVVDMKDEQNRRYWGLGKKGSPEPESYVAYEFRCEDQRTRTHFVIEIDAQTFEYTVRTMPYQLGVINSHCLLRNWDCRIVATGAKDLGLIYGDLARMIIDSLYIPSGLERPELYFKLDSTQEYAFTSIRTYRRGRFHQQRGDEVLNITQVFDMNVRKMVIPDGSKVYNAYNRLSKDPQCPADEPMWIEMSISSTKIEGFLEENRTLRRSQETTWKVDDLLREETVSSMYLMAITMLRNMDGLGCWNDNGAAIPLDETTSTRTGATSVLPVFW